MLYFLKKFFIDDPMERTKKIYFWCFNVIGMHCSFLYIPYYYLYIRRFFRIDKDGRVGLSQACSTIVRGCNLRCEFCTTFSPYWQGVNSADELLASYVEWRKKLKPQFFVLTGGEPLLHPELERIIRESAKIWNDSRLWLGTNGLLLDRIKPEVLQAIKETGYELFVTEHTFDPEHRKKLDAGYARLKQESIPFVVRPSRLTWIARYQYDDSASENRKFIPHKSDAGRALKHCKSCDCTTIYGDKLYRCACVLFARLMTQEGVLNSDLWKDALIYTSPTLQSTPEEILEHLRCRVRPECTVCPDRTNIIPARQLPVHKGEA